MTFIIRFLHLLNDTLGPPPNWKIPAIIFSGILVGMILLILHIANATSYLSDKPETCMNCHVMAPQYATWQRGSHGRVAVCNDCHVPQDNVLRKYFFKASDGARHSFVFTFRLEPQVIQVKSAGIAVIQENCIRCHSYLVQDISSGKVTLTSSRHGAGKLCWECHRETPHGRVNSLASVPYSRVPRLKPVIPEWLQPLILSKPNGE